MASGRMYTMVISQVAFTAQVDAFEISPADDKPCEIVGLFLGQSTEFGDAQDETLTITIIRGFTSSGSGGSATTPQLIDPGDPAAAFAGETMNTSVATTGTSVKLHEDAWNVRAGYAMWWPIGTEPKVSQANTTLVVRISAPADSVTLSATLYVREL